MFSLVIQSITAVLLLSTFVHGQAANTLSPTPAPTPAPTKSSPTLTPNATLILPAAAGGLDLSGGEVIEASLVTVQGQTTIIQLVDSVPDPTQPVQDAATHQEDETVSSTETCTFAEEGKGNATCIAFAIVSEASTVTTLSETDTLSFASIPVVALNFGQSSTTTTPPSSATTSTSTAPPKSAALGQYQVSEIALGITAVTVAIGLSQIAF
ncbi:hypothetical protein Clacol_009568 [Clathrus columnatus]|uniref:Uncharacterized protein n=1 Tax=Clathrus columnatus TaxID=1419009 RepID=A0AAV5ANC3_9AGAM|nr:hypothetical protein Clacol_009568 [Clathrus columnatus]